jgi:hypothetical protein
MSMRPRLGGYWVIALSVAAQAWPASNEAGPRPVTQPGAFIAVLWLFCSIPWLWALAFGHHEDRTLTHGYEPTRETAMAAFAKSWQRE